MHFLVNYLWYTALLAVSTCFAGTLKLAATLFLAHPGSPAWHIDVQCYTTQILPSFGAGPSKWKWVVMEVCIVCMRGIGDGAHVGISYGGVSDG